MRIGARLYNVHLPPTRHQAASDGVDSCVDFRYIVHHCHVHLIGYCTMAEFETLCWRFPCRRPVSSPSSPSLLPLPLTSPLCQHMLTSTCIHNVGNFRKPRGLVIVLESGRRSEGVTGEGRVAAGALLPPLPPTDGTRAARVRWPAARVSMSATSATATATATGFGGPTRLVGQAELRARRLRRRARRSRRTSQVSSCSTF